MVRDRVITSMGFYTSSKYVLKSGLIIPEGWYVCISGENVIVQKILGRDPRLQRFSVNTVFNWCPKKGEDRCYSEPFHLLVSGEPVNAYVNLYDAYKSHIDIPVNDDL